MTVGRLADYAAKCSIQIGTAPPMARPVTETRKTDFDPSHFRIARNQREAGLEHYEWEDRAPPVEGWAKAALGGALIIVFIVAGWFLAGVIG